MEKLSVFVTTYNNQRTLRACLGSVAWADEIVLLDSFSDDATLDIAREFGCAIHQHEFLGYGRQKQLALEHTSHRWVLLLDADEMLSSELADEIRTVLRNTPDAHGYELPRQEQLFWRMSGSGVRWNHYLRLFDKDRGRMSDMPVHAAPKVNGYVKRLRSPFYHFGETDVHTKVDRINAYSTGLVEDKVEHSRWTSPWVMVFYPPWCFFRNFVLKRGFMDGWPGFISSACAAFYAFLKYAKLYEHRQVGLHGDRLMPEGSPPSPVRRVPS